MTFYHWAGALPHWHPVRFRGVDSIVRNDVKLKVCRAPQPHASPVARAISSITRIAVRMRACSHEPPCSHLLTVIGVRPMIAGNTGPRKSTFKSTSTVLPEYQAGVFLSYHRVSGPWVPNPGVLQGRPPFDPQLVPSPSTIALRELYPPVAEVSSSSSQIRAGSEASAVTT